MHAWTHACTHIAVFIVPTLPEGVYTIIHARAPRQDVILQVDADIMSEKAAEDKVFGEPSIVNYAIQLELDLEGNTFEK